ncbi:MAG TPA: hypothetical protein VHY10_13210 [Xanthobacteraceae bacterium]|jgi:hypothetical protein|nr:hypothetical protein [Xanthobacteraceae bacterium]
MGLEEKMMGIASLHPSYRTYPDYAPLDPGYGIGEPRKRLVKNLDG